MISEIDSAPSRGTGIKEGDAMVATCDLFDQHSQRVFTRGEVYRVVAVTQVSGWNCFNLANDHGHGHLVIAWAKHFLPARTMALSCAHRAKLLLNRYDNLGRRLAGPDGAVCGPVRQRLLASARTYVADSRRYLAAAA